MRKKYLVLIYSIAIFIFIVLYLSLGKNKVYTTQDNIGKKLAEVELNYFDKDGEFSTKELAKFKFTLLNFWASWCGPCKKEMPSLDLLQTHKNLNNLKIFPINIGQDNLNKSSKFFNDIGIKNLNIYFDSPITLAKKFGLRGIPTSILFNKKGYEFARIIGSTDFEDEKFIEWLSNYN